MTTFWNDGFQRDEMTNGMRNRISLRNDRASCRCQNFTIRRISSTYKRTPMERQQALAELRDFYHTAQNIFSAASGLAFEHLDELKGEILLTLLSGVNSQCSFLYRFIRSARTRRNWSLRKNSRKPSYEHVPWRKCLLSRNHLDPVPKIVALRLFTIGKQSIFTSNITSSHHLRTRNSCPKHDIT